MPTLIPIRRSEHRARRDQRKHFASANHAHRESKRLEHPEKRAPTMCRTFFYSQVALSAEIAELTTPRARADMFALFFIGLVIGAIVGGGTGAVWGGITGFVLGAMLRSQKKTQPSSAGRTAKSVAPPRIEISLGVPARSGYGKISPLRWVAANTPIEIKGRRIGCGMIYVAEGRTEQFEPSTIGLNLAATKAGTSADGPLSYWPAYYALTSAQRGAYLDWLAQGRRDPNPAEREFGYLFLFFYGLERRVLTEKDYSEEIGREVAEIMVRYGSFGRSKSLPSYFSQLLHFWAHRQGEERYAQLWPWILGLEHNVLDDDELQLILGNLALRGESAPLVVAREIAMRDEEAMRSNVATRSPHEFEQLFRARFETAFPDGLPIEKRQGTKRIDYVAASAALRVEGDAMAITAKAQAAAVPVVERRRLVALWNSCCDDLVGYLRAKTKNVSQAIDLATLVSMPEEFARKEQGALALKFDELLTHAAREGDRWFLIAGPLFTFFGESAREKYTLSQSRQLSLGLRRLGWLLEPDPLLHGSALRADQEIVLYRGDSPLPVGDYLGHCALVQLATEIAHADGATDLREKDTISVFIDEAPVSEPERTRLRAWSALLHRNPDNAPAGLAKIAKAVPAAKGQAVAQLLCHLAAADEVVTKSEQKMLFRIFRALGLSADVQADFRRYMDGFEEVRVSVAEPETAGEEIPVPAAARAPKLSLDRARLQQLKAETAEVIHILSAAMADAEHDAEPSAAVAAPIARPEWCEGLPDPYVPFLIWISTRQSCSRAQFDETAKEHHLMPTAAFDAINSWSDEHLGDFLLSDEDPIIIQRSLLPTS